MTDKRLTAVRGAIQVSRDSDDAIEKAVCTLYTALIDKNSHMVGDDIVCIMFSMTSDLSALNPATALRRGFPDLLSPLFCMQEPEVVGMLPRTIRIMVQFYAPVHTAVQHVYLEGARKLRPDLSI
jgi:chorismate mutase